MHYACVVAVVGDTVCARMYGPLGVDGIRQVILVIQLEQMFYLIRSHNTDNFPVRVRRWAEMNVIFISPPAWTQIGL